jgi:hypothetical protein
MDLSSNQGLLLAARFARPPNALHYCGPERQHDLLQYLRENRIDPGLTEILTAFETMHPYLVLISWANKISNPYHPKVVEAYFLGNQLLNNVSKKSFARFLEERLLLRKKLSVKQWHLVRDTWAAALPFHTFHVLNIFRRIEHQALPNTLETMDSCRISWGRVTQIKINNSLVVMAPRLTIMENELQLTRPRPVLLPTDLPQVKNGDFVSFHWGQMVTKLSNRQLLHLRFFTNQAIRAYNRSYAPSDLSDWQ